MNWLADIAQWLRQQAKTLPWSKQNLRRIEGLSADEAQRLQAAFPDQETLQQEIDGYPGSVFHDLAQRTNLTERTLAGAVARSLNLWSKPSLLGRLRQHWADWALLVLVAAFVLDYLRPLGPTYSVKARREIPSLQRIDAKDLEEVISPGQSGESAAQYVGKFAISFVPQGKALSAADLSPDFTTVRIETKKSVIAVSPAEPQRVTLVLSSRQKTPDGVTMPALLVDIEASGTTRTATLRIASKHQAQFAKWVGSGDAWIISAGR
jgi:hypothetical protein